MPCRWLLAPGKALRTRFARPLRCDVNNSRRMLSFLSSMSPDNAELRAEVARTRLSVAVGCITEVRGADAIVNCANEHLVGTQLPYINLDGAAGCVFHCVDGVVHKRAGPELHEACMSLAIEEGSYTETWGGIRCPSGQARVTPAFSLPHCAHIVHVVGPPWPSDAEELRDAYSAGIKAALAVEGPEARPAIRSLAVPAISSGIYQWPRDMSWAAAVQSLGGHLLEASLRRGGAGELPCPQDGARSGLDHVIFSAWDAASGREVEECLRRWVDGTLTEDGLL
ncbi:unnamed protein product [Polarella glacialis]|uniref:Macro domain-containing protein n=1 Tax=Polarella glacialis TaxID=89957 RepID=A0A813HVD8_POLGL|nr:unnamed protein product [Polarella glacialis]